MDFVQIAKAFATYHVDSMSLGELRAVAINSQFDELCNAAGSIDSEVLIDSLLQCTGGDTDAMRELMVSFGADDKEAEQIIAQFIQ